MAFHRDDSFFYPSPYLRCREIVFVDGPHEYYDLIGRDVQPLAEKDAYEAARFEGGAVVSVPERMVLDDAFDDCRDNGRWLQTLMNSEKHFGTKVEGI